MKPQATSLIVVMNATKVKQTIAWSMVGQERPDTGQELDNAKLVAALQQHEVIPHYRWNHVNITWDEIKQYGLAQKGVCDGDFVRVGDDYFQVISTYHSPGRGSMPYFRREFDKYFLDLEEYRDCPVVILVYNTHEEGGLTSQGYL
jgi:hypothetical protein